MPADHHPRNLRTTTAAFFAATAFMVIALITAGVLP